VVFGAAKFLVAIAVAGRHQRVVDAARIVVQYRQDRPAVIAQQCIADARDQPMHRGAAVFHRHELRHVVAVECPGVDHLLTVRVDHAGGLAGCDECGFAASRGDGDCCFGHQHFPVIRREAARDRDYRSLPRARPHKR
jgi:hypothetical protein